MNFNLFGRLVSRGIIYFLPLGMLIILTSTRGAVEKTSADDLESGFANPPLQARSRAFWWWLNANVNQAAITKDLEWMKQIGMGGALIMDCDNSAGPVPAGPMFSSPPWRDLFDFAVKESSRLGLKLTLTPQSGANLGGPYVKPEQATKHITWSECRITGPTKFTAKLPAPPNQQGFYQDSKTIAYRLKSSAVGAVAPPEVIARSSQWPKRPEWVFDGNETTVWSCSNSFSKANPEWVELNFPSPTTLSGIKIVPSKSAEPRKGEWQISKDGKEFQTIQTFDLKEKGVISLSFPVVTASRFRLVIHESFGNENRQVSIAEIILLDQEGKPLDIGHHAPALANLELKSLYTESVVPLDSDDPLYKPGDEDTNAKEVVDLTSHLEPDGTLRWEVPEGTWQVLRFGCTVSNGRVSGNSLTKPAWSGYVVDYLDAEALKSYWQQVVDPLMADIKPYMGQAFKGFSTDSWEGGGINWTAKFPEEFRKRRGYYLTGYLPVLAGRIVDSRNASDRFLYDLRKTVGELMADNHFAVMQQLAAKQGLMIHCEAGGPHSGPFDALKNWGRCDWPMGEFWVYSPHRPTDEKRFFMKGPASAAHIYGKRIVCGEAFTSIGPQWNDILWSSQKPTFDHEACAGLNLIFWHAFTCSPPEMGVPGQEYYAGTHIDPQITWANQAHSFIEYINRCQFLLQQGQFVADVCYYYGDHVPNVPGRKQADPAKILPTYDYDYLNEEVLLTRLSVKHGRLTLPDGMSYQILALPNLKVMSLEALKKIQQLVHDGATVVGPRPERNPSLTNYPIADQTFQEICDELWGSRKVEDKPAKQVLAKLGVEPDFEAPSELQLDYIHRRDDETEIYFVSNPKAQTIRFSGIFRVTDKQPELWDAVSGHTQTATQFQQSQGRITVPMELPPYGSLFVIFRKASNGTKTAEPNFHTFKTLTTIAGSWTVSFDPKWGGPATAEFPELVSWLKRPEEGIHNYSGTAIYKIAFDLSSLQTANQKKLYIDLGDVREIAEVRVNGANLGVLWCPPWRVDMSHAVHEGRNELEIIVVNTWFNRVLFDQSLPKDKRLTHTPVTLKSDSKPLDSGLLGPVKLLVEE